MNENIKSKYPSKWLSEGIFISIIPIIGYLFSYVFEISYADSFGIPRELISISLSTILQSISLILMLILIFYVTFDFLLAKSYDHPLLHKFKHILFFSMWTLPVFLRYLNEWNILRFYLLGFLFYLLLIFGLPIIRFREKGSFYNRLVAENAQWKKNIDENDFLVNLFSFLGEKGTKLIFYTYLGLWIAYSWGGLVAVRKVEFLITNTKPEMAVLRVYEDNIICAPLDRKNKTIKREISVFKISDRNDLVLRPEKVGPLSLEKTKEIFKYNFDKKIIEKKGIGVRPKI